MAAERGGLYMDYTWYKPLCMVYTICESETDS